MAKYNIGISILDTRDLHQSASTPIQTRHYVVGSKDYFMQVSWNFAFGTSLHCTLSQIQEDINKLVAGRDSILIVHRGKNDHRWLEAAKVNIQPLYTLDTRDATQHIFELDSRCTLQQILPLLEIPYDPEMLGNTGNIAKFTSRAMLLLAVLGTKKLEQEEQGQNPSPRTGKLSVL
ncbi:uncharacterized protein RSE6_01782 [Rhynchosporium secalis]|uniref:Gfd2/YDR514C-like C-terminal domain-containing protein n=1 Tax=Rhynchosporium secalis TaxID=38038 RepID=A0A1E1LYN3_RHYSE|nr:uncharacterized protein RSE6_01782 [Rhynchosporium secalis]